MRRPRNFIGPSGMGGTVSLWGASSLIQSIQRGTIALNTAVSNTQTAAITAVDMSRTRLVCLGWNINTGTSNNQAAVRVAFTNSTTITASVNGGSGGGVINTVSYEIVEYYPGVIKSLQRGTALGNGTAAITEVNTAKTMMDWLCGSGSDANTNITSITRVVLTNSTTVTATGVGSNQDTAGFQVVEFF